MVLTVANCLHLSSIGRRIRSNLRGMAGFVVLAFICATSVLAESGRAWEYDSLLDTQTQSRSWSDQSLSSWYRRYNEAVQLLVEGDVQEAMENFSALIGQAALEVDSDILPEIATELSALEQQARLSLGRLYIEQGKFGQATAVLDDIPLDGLLSEPALFEYALAASRQGKHGLAVKALQTLQNRPLFTPWRQQVPYARAFNIEQMNQPEAALRAYRDAAEHYHRLDQHLAHRQSNLTEQWLMKALESGQGQVRPQDFSLAELVARDSFQLALRNLHGLYRLEAALDPFREQLAFVTRLDEFARGMSGKPKNPVPSDQIPGQVLDRIQQDLMTLVESELTSQRREIAGYLQTSRHAQARLADRLFLSGRAPAAPESAGIETEVNETLRKEMESPDE